MKNYYKSGEIHEVTAPADLVSGQVLKVGSNIGVVVEDALTGKKAQLRRFGHYKDLPKATGEAWTNGDLLYWNDTNKNFTKTAGGAVKAGTAGGDAGSGDTSGEVILVPTI